MRRLASCLVLLAAVSQCVLPLDAWSQAPYRLHPTREILLFAGGAAAGIAALSVHNTTDPLSQDEIAALSRQDVNPFDRGATWNYSESAGVASDYLVFGLIAAPPAFLLEGEIRKDWQTFLIMYAEALLLTGASVQLVKGLVSRTRPYAYNADVPPGAKTTVDTRKSFYSSHTAFAFTSAVFLAATYSEYCPKSPWRVWVWTIALSAASTVAVLRYAAGEHFPTDILVGTAVGAAVGYLVPAIHRTGSDDVSIIPAGGPGSASVSVMVHF